MTHTLVASSNWVCLPHREACLTQVANYTPSPSRVFKCLRQMFARRVLKCLQAMCFFKGRFIFILILALIAKKICLTQVANYTASPSRVFKCFYQSPRQMLARSVLKCWQAMCFSKVVLSLFWYWQWSQRKLVSSRSQFTTQASCASSNASIKSWEKCFKTRFFSRWASTHSVKRLGRRKFWASASFRFWSLSIQFF